MLAPSSLARPRKEALRHWRSRHEQDLRVLAGEFRGAAGVLLVGDSITEDWARPFFRSAGPFVEVSCKAPCGVGSRALAALSAQLARPFAAFAIGDDRIEDLSLRMFRMPGGDRVRSASPAALVIMVGTNDMWIGDAVEVAQKEVQQLLVDLQRTLPAGTHVVLNGLLPQGLRYFDRHGAPVPWNASSPEFVWAQRFNGFQQKLAATHASVSYLDCTEALLQGGAVLPPEAYTDMCHLSATGYERWASCLAPHLKAILGTSESGDATSSRGRTDRAGATSAATRELRPREAQVPPPASEGFEDPIEMLWQRPGDALPPAVVLLAHGCAHQGTDFWPATHCERCLGLPEEVAILRVVLARGYLAIALTSLDRETGCWRPEDLPRAERALEHLYHQESLPPQTPLFAFGASSGGAFVGQLAALPGLGRTRLKCRISEIMAVPGTPSFNDGEAASWPAPPTLFVHMPRDERTAGRVATALGDLWRGNITAAEVHCDPVAITEHFFAARVEGVTNAQSEALFRVLRSGGLLEADGLLKDDPRSDDTWREAMLASGVPQALGDSLAPDESRLGEQMTRAWAAHEMCATHAEAMLDFCEDPPRACADRGWACAAAGTDDASRRPSI